MDVEVAPMGWWATRNWAYRSDTYAPRNGCHWTVGNIGLGQVTYRVFVFAMGAYGGSIMFPAYCAREILVDYSDDGPMDLSHWWIHV